MTDIERLKNLDLRLAVLYEKCSQKPRFNEKEKEKFKEDICEICEALSEILTDESLDNEFRERLAESTRKQMVLIKKAISDLQGLVKVSRNVLS